MRVLLSSSPKVYAVLVLYHPEISTLRRLFRSLERQVEKAIVVDNTPGSTDEFASLFSEFPTEVVYLPLGENTGIAAAQNAGIRRALTEGCSHVILFDQDSAPSGDMVETLLAAERGLLQNGKKVAAVGPHFVDEKNGKPSCAVRHAWFRVERVEVEPDSTEPVATDYLISSGSLIRSDVLNRVGMMQDELFIDWVDAEWGFRAGRDGYQAYIIPSVKMLHSIGDSSVSLLGREITTHSLIRHFYIVRNGAYLLRGGSANWKVRTHMMLAVPKHIAVHTWLSDRRLESFTAMVRGAWWGLRGNLRGNPS